MTNKKSFKSKMIEQQVNAAAVSYITGAQEQEVKEIKSKRLNVLLKPSIYDRIDKIATMKRMSVNELINIVLDDYGNNNQDLINKFNETFGG